MLVSADKELIEHARKLSTQARDPAPHYQHSEIGYNYRLSNLLAAVGRGQLRVLAERVAAKRRIFDYYADTIGDLPGITPGIRDQGSGIRDQGSGIRDQGSGVRDQWSGAAFCPAQVPDSWPLTPAA